MKLEEQLIDLELAKQLKEIGMKMPSFYSHFMTYIQDGVKDKIVTSYSSVTNVEDKKWPAYSSCELMAIIPHIISIEEDKSPFNHFRIRITKSFTINVEEGNMKSENNYIVNYECDTITPQDSFMKRHLFSNISSHKFSDALAKTIIELHRLGYLFK